MSTINNTIKTILLITSLLLLNACSDDDSILTAFTNSKSIDAPYIKNLPRSTTKEEIDIEIKTVPNASIYLNDRHIGKANADGIASVKLSIDTKSNFTYFTLKIKKDDSFGETLNFSIEYIKDEIKQEPDTKDKQTKITPETATTQESKKDKTQTKEIPTSPQTTTTQEDIDNPIALEFKTTTINLKEGSEYKLQVQALYKQRDKRKEDITSKVQWIIPNTKQIQITQGRLKALKDGSLSIKARYKNITSKPLKITIYKEINGYKLPPEPDPKINNSTLLGIDSNDNGVRDDVERYLLEKYKDHHKIVSEIALQSGRAFQIVLEKPEKETYKYISNALHCNMYFKDDADYYGDKILIDDYITDYKFENLQLNTKERIRAYLKQSHNLSGTILHMPIGLESKSQCDFNVTKLLGTEK